MAEKEYIKRVVKMLQTDKGKLFKLVDAVPCESELEGQPGSCPARRHGLCGEVLKLPYCAVANIVENLISADVVEVVKCKDCRWYDDPFSDDFVCMLPVKLPDGLKYPRKEAMPPYGFCSKGERREEDAVD